MEDAIDMLQELNRGFIRSVQSSDARWFDEHLSEDFLNSNADGSLSSRAEFLGNVAKPCPVSNLDIEDVRIRLMGEVALIHARTVYKKSDGQPGKGRYTDVWARQGGRWICVAADVTRG